MAELKIEYKPGQKMAWKIKKDPKAPAEPRFHHPGRCMNCGHLEIPDKEMNINEFHDPEVGCMVPDGTKYIEDEEGNGAYMCSCIKFIPVLKEETSE